MWDLPGPGIKPVSLALVGGFLTTAPPGKSLPLSFMTWALLKSTGQLYSRISLSLGLSRHQMQVKCLGRNPEALCPPQCILSGEQRVDISFYSDVAFGHLVMVLCPGFVYHKVTVFLFVINKYLRGDTWDCKYPVFPQTFADFRIHQWIWQLLDLFSQGDFLFPFFFLHLLIRILP